MFFLKKSMITPFESKIFIFIKRFVLKLSTTCMSLMNLIIIDFFFDVFFFMKKENEVHSLMKYLSIKINFSQDDYRFVFFYDKKRNESF